MRVRNILIITAILSSALAAVVVYLVLTVPNDVQAAALLQHLRNIYIHGKVQGVGYRFFATRVARRLGFKGWIPNNRDGAVEALVEGEKSAIDELIEEIHEGPRYAEVTKFYSDVKEYT